MKIFLVVFASMFFWGAHAQKSDHQIIEELLHNTIKFYQMLRADNGLYYDYVSTEGQTNRGSAAIS